MCGNVGNVVTWYVLVSLAFCLVSFGHGFYLDVSFWRLWCLLETMETMVSFGRSVLLETMVSFEHQGFLETKGLLNTKGFLKPRGF